MSSQTSAINFAFQLDVSVPASDERLIGFQVQTSSLITTHILVLTINLK